MTRVLKVDGAGFLLDGEPFDMWGIRLANALENDQVSRAVVGQLDEYLKYGVNTFSVFLQGGSTGSANPFDADGSFTRRTRREESSGAFRGRGDVEGLALRNTHMDRLAVLVEEADRRGMVVNVGVFYQARIRQLAGEEAIRRATANVAKWLVQKGYRNVFMDLVNEYGHGGFSGVGLCYGVSERYAADGGEALLKIFKEAGPEIPAGISALGERAGVFAGMDVALIHQPFDPGRVRRAAGRELPVVLNEWGHGAVGAGRDDENGLYTEEDVAKWASTVSAVRGGGGFVFYHAAWKQHLTEAGGPHFELGPPGAQSRTPRGGEPSDHWYFDLVQRIRGPEGEGR